MLSDSSAARAGEATRGEAGRSQHVLWNNPPTASPFSRSSL